MYDLARVTKEFTEACNKAGIEVKAPIQLNSRLTSTLGRVHVERHGYDWTPTKVEFSKKLLENAEDSSVRDVILHEASHYIVTARTHENHGHDAVFKAVCAEIGTTNDKVETDVAWIGGKDPNTDRKYSVICPTCNKVVGRYSRMCATLKNIDFCTCGICHKGGLVVVQNY